MFMGKRIDVALSEKFNITRSRAKQLIEEGKVQIDDKIITKPAMLVEEDENIKITESKQYVSRGAYKLKKALSFFNVLLKDKIVLDMGASTGGFCQVALENGAKKVYAVDVGNGVLDKSLCQDERVVNYENKDVRNLTLNDIPNCDFITGDLSFISLKLVLPHINMLLPDVEMILLFKPQFECGPKIARKYKGVIKDRKIHIELLKEFIEFVKNLNITVCDLTYSAIKGKSGNIEYLLHLNGEKEKNFDVEWVVAEAFKNLNN